MSFEVCGIDRHILLFTVNRDTRRKSMGPDPKVAKSTRSNKTRTTRGSIIRVVKLIQAKLEYGFLY